jgi:tripartite-type tricarboxylate transporter receptor subunit TctC
MLIPPKAFWRGAAVAAAIAATAAPGLARADTYPSRPLRIIVTFAPGGTADVLARDVAIKLGAELGQAVVVENRPGASGVIGASALASAAPDGYTLGVTSGSHTAAPFVMKMSFDMLKDIKGVTLIASVPNVLCVSSDSPANTLPELLALARAHPNTLSYGHAGNFTASHLGMELLKLQSKTDMIAVAYKGGGPALAGLLGKQVTMSVSGPPPYLPHIQAGAIKPIATTGLQRSPALPNVPTFSESGMPGFEMNEWYGISVPARTPPEIVARLNAALVKVIRQPDMVARMAAFGAIAVGDSPAEFDAFFKREMDKTGKLIRDLDLKAD